MTSQPLLDHLATGLTTTCQAWAIIRRDGLVQGFTDHDQPLEFDGISFSADAGLTARAIASATGLAVDNSEAMGILSDTAIRDEDVEAGRYDGATVTSWLVNWADPSQRMIRFSGTIGEIRRGQGVFHAELRGQAELLNQPQGRAYLKSCSAVLGDTSCGVDLDTFSTTRAAETVSGNQVLRFADFDAFVDGWYDRGRVVVLSGAATGLASVIRQDRRAGTARELILWEPFRAEIATGDLLRIEAGCDKSIATCQLKFANVLNFRGFPDIPGEDWLVSVPRSSGTNTGGSRGR